MESNRERGVEREVEREEVIPGCIKFVLFLGGLLILPQHLNQGGERRGRKERERKGSKTEGVV